MHLTHIRSALLILALTLALAVVPQVLRPTTAAAQTPNALTLCGTVSAYTAATSSAAGTVTIGGGPAVTIAPGTTISGGLTVGSNVCIVAQTNATGQLAGGIIFTNATPVSGLIVCGNVTAVGTSSVTIGGLTFNLASGVSITGAALTTSSALCLTLTLNSSGQVTAGTAATTLSVAPPTICGTVTAFTAATATVAGTITINGVTLPIAVGTTLTGTTVTVGSQFCLAFTLGAGGQIATGAVTVPLAATPYYGHRHHGAGGPTLA